MPSRCVAGVAGFHPTELKAEYLRELVLAGFKHIDAVSFVSPKHVKQMADSEEVMAKLNDSLSIDIDRPEIIGIVVNEKGPGARAGDSRRHDHRLSVLDLRLFPPRQRQHEPRRIAQARRETEKGRPRQRAATS